MTATSSTVEGFPQVLSRQIGHTCIHRCVYGHVRAAEFWHLFQNLLFFGTVLQGSFLGREPKFCLNALSALSSSPVAAAASFAAAVSSAVAISCCPASFWPRFAYRRVSYGNISRRYCLMEHNRHALLPAAEAPVFDLSLLGPSSTHVARCTFASEMLVIRSAAEYELLSQDSGCLPPKECGPAAGAPNTIRELAHADGDNWNAARRRPLMYALQPHLLAPSVLPSSCENHLVGTLHNQPHHLRARRVSLMLPRALRPVSWPFPLHRGFG